MYLSARGLGRCRPVSGMDPALFDFRRKSSRHACAMPSQFNPEARDDGGRQPLRITFQRAAAKFDDAVGDHFANGIGILRAMEHGEDGVEGFTKKFGTDIVENGVYSHDAPRAGYYCDGT